MRHHLVTLGRRSLRRRRADRTGSGLTDPHGVHPFPPPALHGGGGPLPRTRGSFFYG